MKNTKELSREYRLSHWREVIKEQKRSGLSIKAYSEREGFHANIYYYWQRQLRELALKEVQAVIGTQGKEIVPAGWKEVSIGGTKADESGEIRIEIGKSRVFAGPRTDTELLGKVCKVLVSIC